MALGGGMELALACDMLVAGRNARFALPEVRRGLLAGAGGCIRLARSVPRAIALELVTTGGSLDAEEAFRLGLANRLVDAGSEVPVALTMAADIANNAPVAVRESLRLARIMSDSGEQNALHAQDAAIVRVLASPDAQEGARAFVEKRSPLWTDR